MAEPSQSNNNDEPMASDVGFELAPDDPRRTENRGGIEATVGVDNEAPPDGRGTSTGAATAGTTGADITNRETADDVGASGTGRSNSSQLNLNTTGMFAPDTGPAGVGPVEGSTSGAIAPKIEMTDIGLVDVNAVDMSLPDDEESGAGARVEDENGNPL